MSSFIETQAAPISRTVINVMRHCRESFFIARPLP